MSNSAINYLNVPAQGKVKLSLSLSNSFPFMEPFMAGLSSSKISAEEVAALDALTSDFTVVEGFEDAQGKFASGLGNVAVIDCHYMDEFTFGLKE